MKKTGHAGVVYQDGLQTVDPLTRVRGFESHRPRRETLAFESRGLPRGDIPDQVRKLNRVPQPLSSV